MHGPRKAVLAALAAAIVVALVIGVALGRHSGGGRAVAEAPKARHPAVKPAPVLSVARLRAMGVDEGGLVPVLMYHQILATIPAGDDYSRTPAELRSDLGRLEREGYVSISLSDLVDGHIAVPAGKSPVVLTFDDSSASQFRYLPDGKLDPNSAVGILNAFSAAHPDFGRHGMFYLNATLFDQPALAKRKLDELIRWGYEIGNHTLTHANLGHLSASATEAEIGKMAALVAKLEPSYRLRHFCLPFGASPRPASLATTGSYRGVPYRYLSATLVGAEPAPSPFARRFDPLALPRVRAAGKPGQELLIDYWLDRLTKADRFVSDGDPQTVTIPRRLVPRVRVRDGQRLRVL